jgi:nucleotide-binding universal stress UspA family protein
MKTILAPIDFSKVSARVAVEAMALARGLGGTLVLLNVTTPPFASADDPRAARSVIKTIEAVGNTASRRLERLRKKLGSNGVRVSSVHVTGLPVPSILQEAEAISADYIVMGSHGHNALYDLVVGSTASGVMNRAACPVLIVPPSKPRTASKKKR